MKYLVTSIGLVFLLFQTSCSTQQAIANYSGDGEIFAMPDGGFVQGGGGYQVRFKRVRLDHPAHLTYHFTGLPKIAWHVDVFFALEGPQEWEWKDYYDWHRRHYPNEAREQTAVIDDLKGTLAMTLRDAKGNVIFDVHHKLSEFVWSGSGHDPWELYDHDFKMAFTADIRTEYILEVSIEPDAILKDTEGYVLFRSGGHEGFSL